MAENESIRGAADSLPRNIYDLLERINREWAALEESIAGLSPQRMDVPDAGGWSVKDNLAHVGEWEHYLLHSILEGEPADEVLKLDPATLRAADEDVTNAVLYSRNKDRSFDDVLSGLRSSHRQLVTALAQIPFADLLKQVRPDNSDAGLVLESVIGNTYEHYREHRATIERLAA